MGSKVSVDKETPRKQLELIYAGEIQRLFTRFPRKGGLSDEDIKRLVELTKGLKELDALPDPKPISKRVKDASSQELMEIVRNAQDRTN